MQKNVTEDIVYGKNSVLESINTVEVSKIYLTKECMNNEISTQLSKKNIPFVFVDKFFLNKMTKNAPHQGIAAVVSPTDYMELSELVAKNKSIENPMIIMLDEVQDANNLGAILRVIDAFSVNGVIFNKRRNIQLTGAVAKTSTGAINHVDITRVTNLVSTIKTLKKDGYWVAYLDMDGEQNVQDFDFNLPLVVVVGGEDKGVTENIKKNCDFGITINMTGHVNSLNVAGATTILCYQKSLS
jgi:23S rRNA (guanosine2251-2'-O)-methyltransferase